MVEALYSGLDQISKFSSFLLRGETASLLDKGHFKDMEQEGRSSADVSIYMPSSNVVTNGHYATLCLYADEQSANLSVREAPLASSLVRTVGQVTDTHSHCQVAVRHWTIRKIQELQKRTVTWRISHKLAQQQGKVSLF